MLRTVFSGAISVSMSRKPRPSASVSPPSMPSGSRTVRPSICSPPQMPMIMPPRRRCASRSRSQPWRRKKARSAMVDFDPGRITSPASVGSRSPGLTNTSSTSGLRLERIEIVEIGDPRQHRHSDPERPRLAARQPLERHGILGRKPRRGLEPGNHSQTRPSGEFFSIAEMPSSNRLTSPRNLLMR